MPAMTQNVSQQMLSKSITCSEDTKSISTCFTKHTHANDDTKCISTCVDQTPPKPARSENATQHVLNKPITYKRGYKIHQTLRGHKMHLNKGLTKIIPCQRGRQMHLNMCRPNPSHACEDTKCISTCVDKTHLMLARTQNVSTCVDQTHRLPSRTKMYLKMF